jgi:hypothetical protein
MDALLVVPAPMKAINEERPHRNFGFLHIPAKRFNPGSRRQGGLGSDPDRANSPLKSKAKKFDDLGVGL